MKLFLICLVSATVSHASPIIGSLPLNGGGIFQNGLDLSVSTMISANSMLNLSLGSGDYAFIPIGTNFGASTLNYTSNATLASFAFSSPVGARSWPPRTLRIRWFKRRQIFWMFLS